MILKVILKRIERFGAAGRKGRSKGRKNLIYALDIRINEILLQSIYVLTIKSVNRFKKILTFGAVIAQFITRCKSRRAVVLQRLRLRFLNESLYFGNFVLQIKLE